MSTEPINYADKLGITGRISRQCANIAPEANASAKADVNYPLSGNYSSQPKTESGFANISSTSHNPYSQHAQSLPPPSRPSMSFGSLHYAGNISNYNNYGSNSSNNRYSDLSEAQTPSNQSISSFPSSSGATNYSDGNSSLDASPLANNSKYLSSKTTDFSNTNTNNNITSHSPVIPPPPPMLPPVSSAAFNDIDSLPRFGSSINSSNHHTLPQLASGSVSSDIGLTTSTAQINNNQTMFPPLPSMAVHTQYQHSIGSMNGNPANYNNNTNESLRDPEFTESDIKTLKNLLSTGEKVKWKYISNQLQLQKDGKRASPSSCAKKASELFNLPKDEMQGSLGTSLPYVVHPNGWSNIDNGFSQQHGCNNVGFQSYYGATH